MPVSSSVKDQQFAKLLATHQERRACHETCNARKHRTESRFALRTVLGFPWIALAVLNFHGVLETRPAERLTWNESVIKRRRDAFFTAFAPRAGFGFMQGTECHIHWTSPFKSIAENIGGDHDMRTRAGRVVKKRCVKRGRIGASQERGSEGILEFQPVIIR